MGRVVLLAALVTVPAVSGCGTVQNMLSDRCDLYGGTALDTAVVKAGFKEGVAQIKGDTTPALHRDELPPTVSIALGPLALADLPLSIIGDTLTLPWVILAGFKHMDEDLRREGDSEWEAFWLGDQPKPASSGAGHPASLALPGS